MRTLRSIIWILIPLAALAVAFYWWIIIPRSILDHGETAQAQVIDVWATSTSINDEPLAGLLLEVRPAGKAPYQVKKYCRATFYNEGILAPGVQVEVRYNHAYPQRVMISSFECDAELNSIGMIGLAVPGFILLTWLAIPLFGLIGQLRSGTSLISPSVVQPPISTLPRAKPTPEEIGEGDEAARLEKLEVLRQKGLITPDEYERLRSKIIDSL